MAEAGMRAEVAVDWRTGRLTAAPDFGSEGWLTRIAADGNTRNPAAARDASNGSTTQEIRNGEA